jgi:cytochrome c5
MKMPFTTVITLAALSLSTQLVASEQSTTVTGTESNGEAKALYENHCLACHQPHKGGKGQHSGKKSNNDKQAHGDGAHPKRLAPPMAMVKKHYLKTYPDRAQFIEKISDWVKVPDANTAMLYHAVEKFGVMPPLSIDEASRRQIAGYIYDVLPTGHGKKGGCKKGGKH